MDIKSLQSTVINALEDVKAQEIRVYDTTHLTSLFDRIAIASGTSNRQTRALAASVRDKVKASGGSIISIEGEDTGEWVLVDLGDMIVHIMQPAIRQYYHLEEIWGEKPIRLRLGAPKPVVPAKKAAPVAKKEPTSLRRSTAVKTIEREATAAKKAAARKAAPAKKPGAGSTARTAAGKAALKKPAAKAAAKKAPAKKSPTRA